MASCDLRALLPLFLKRRTIQMINAATINMIRKSTQTGQMIIILDICWVCPAKSTVKTALKMPNPGVFSHETFWKICLSGRILAVIGLSSLV